jgi:DNA-binding MarR family transcriptional regulator
MRANRAERSRLAVTRLSRRLRQQAPAGITLSMLSALSSIIRHGPITLGKLAAGERVQPPTMSRVVDSLVSAGLVTRTKNPDDARSAAIEATSEGRALVRRRRASTDAYLINTSSVNGFWASLGPDIPHTAYSAAKFAVKGFTEALINDLRLNAPHVGVSLVMPGHVGTSIVLNSPAVLGRHSPKEMTAEELRPLRERFAQRGLPTDALSDDMLRAGMQQMAENFRDKAPLSAAAAATIILDGVRKGSWRILVGEDAKELDRMVRAAPERAYEPGFMDELRAKGHLGLALDPAD